MTDYSRRPDLGGYASKAEAPAARGTRVPDLADPDAPAAPKDMPKTPRKDYVLNTRLDPQVRDQLADLQRFSPIPRATLRQVLETVISQEWHRTFDEKGERRIAP